MSGGPMRRKERRIGEDVAWAVFEEARVVHLASTTADGEPLARTVHGVVVDGALCFHGAPAGEKMEILGRPVVVTAEEIVASIPSWFLHPERACPATTLYRSAHLRGVAEAVEDAETKSRVLAALMTRFQPGGGYRPIDPADPMYRAAVAGIAIVRIVPTTIEGKASLLQEKPPEHRAKVLEALWRRGTPEDLAAIETVRAAAPDAADPAFLTGPSGAKLHGTLGRVRVAEAVALLRGEYWNVDRFDDATIAATQLGSSAWVGATDPSGALVATMRAVSDTAKMAWFGDVAVRPDWRGRGLGDALLSLLLDHPFVRGVRRVELKTRDAMGFYARHGFHTIRTEGDRSVMERVSRLELGNAGQMRARV